MVHFAGHGHSVPPSLRPRDSAIWTPRSTHYRGSFLGPREHSWAPKPRAQVYTAVCDGVSQLSDPLEGQDSNNYSQPYLTSPAGLLRGPRWLQLRCHGLPAKDGAVFHRPPERRLAMSASRRVENARANKRRAESTVAGCGRTGRAR